MVRPGTTRHSTWSRRMVGRLALVVAAAAGVVLAAAVPAAAEPSLAPLAADSLQQVINNVRTFIVGLLVALATLFLTIAGVRYLTAAGDPGQVGKAKEALRNAAVGYALAALAPLLVTALQSIVS